MKVVLELKDSVLREFNFEKKNAALSRASFYVRVFWNGRILLELGVGVVALSIDRLVGVATGFWT